MVRREHLDADPWTVQSLNVFLQWEIYPKGRERGDLNGMTVPEYLDTLEEEESENSLTIHSASYRKLRLLSTSSDDSGIAIEDADSEYLLWSCQTANMQLAVSNSLLSFLISWGEECSLGGPASTSKNLQIFAKNPFLFQ